MKKKTIFASVGAVLLASIFTTGLLVGSANRINVVKTSADEVITKYLPVNGTNFYTGTVGGDAFDGKSIAELTSGRMDTFHDGRRQYNALDNFLNTTLGSGEGRKGAVRSIRWVHKGGYVSFLMGGNNDNFVNIFDETDKVDRVVQIRSGFYSSRGDAWDDGYRDGTNPAFELSLNMSLKFAHLSDDWIGHEFIVYIEDNTTAYYGGVTFGDLRVNQTLEEVARTFSAHKQQVALDAQIINQSNWIQNQWAANYILNTLYQSEYYAELRTAEAALNNADEGFETYALSNWAFDSKSSSAVINFSGIVSDNDAKDWTERMPANKTGNFYVNADVSGIGESEKYRLVSSEFTLSGTGIISAKLGGGTAVMCLIDSTGTELASTRIAAAENENILNPAFVENGHVENIMAYGSRYNTMSRVFLDASAHLGKKVRITLADERTGGNWGLAYFDEVVTKYDSVPTFRVEKIHQQFGENPTYHGVVTDKYVGSNTTTFGKAYEFVQSYYSTMRAMGNAHTWCSTYQSSEAQALLVTYNALDSDVKALVDAAQDYDFGAAATTENWYLSEANTNRTVGQSLAYIATLPTTSPARFVSAEYRTSKIAVMVSGIILVSAVGLFALVTLKKRKVER